MSDWQAVPSSDGHASLFIKFSSLGQDANDTLHFARVPDRGLQVHEPHVVDDFERVAESAVPVESVECRAEVVCEGRGVLGCGVGVELLGKVDDAAWGWVCWVCSVRLGRWDRRGRLGVRGVCGPCWIVWLRDGDGAGEWSLSSAGERKGDDAWLAVVGGGGWDE